MGEGCEKMLSSEKYLGSSIIFATSLGEFLREIFLHLESSIVKSCKTLVDLVSLNYW